jgi:hypothetical protein
MNFGGFMDRRVLIWAMAVVLTVPVVFGVGYWAYWNFYEKYRPVTLTKNQAEIVNLLEAANYVSPIAADDRQSAFVYMISYKGCKACDTYQTSEFSKLKAAGVDTRVIVFAPEGLAQSTGADRSTVAELWLNPRWDLYETWRTDPVWDAAHIPPADGNLARTAVVEASRKFTADLKTYLAANRVDVRYPLIIWRDKNNGLKVCACTDEGKMFHFIREDFNAPSDAPDITEAKPLSEASASAILSQSQQSLSAIRPKPEPEPEPETMATATSSAN